MSGANSSCCSAGWRLQCPWLSRWQQWTDLVCAIFRLSCNSQFRAPVLWRNAARLSSACLAAPSQRKVVWGCARKGSVCKAAPGLCCSPSRAQVQPVCGTWGSLNTQNVFISCCTNCPSVSGCPFLAWILEHFFPCFNPFSLLSEPSLQVERGRRTNEEVESYGGRKRERNCKPSKTVTGKVYTLSWGVCIYMYKVYICECISLYIIYLYLYMSIYCLFSFNRMCKKKMNLSKLKYRN